MREEDSKGARSRDRRLVRSRLVRAQDWREQAPLLQGAVLALRSCSIRIGLKGQGQRQGGGCCGREGRSGRAVRGVQDGRGESRRKVLSRCATPAECLSLCGALTSAPLVCMFPRDSRLAADVTIPTLHRVHMHAGCAYKKGTSICVIPTTLSKRSRLTLPTFPLALALAQASVQCAANRSSTSRATSRACDDGRHWNPCRESSTILRQPFSLVPTDFRSCCSPFLTCSLPSRRNRIIPVRR